MAYERICCPKCELSFGQEAKFIEHLKTVHGVSDHLALYLSLHHGGTYPSCACSSDCKEKIAWAGWKKGFTSKYVRGHNARLDSTYLNPARQAEFAEKRKAGYADGRYSSWNTGLTKETDERVAAMSQKIGASIRAAYESGSLSDWRRGDPEKAAAAAQKISQTRKEKYASGELAPWNLGLTKGISEAVSRAADSIAQNYVENPHASAKRFTPQDIVEIVKSTDEFELLTDPAEYKNKYQKLSIRCKKCGSVQNKNVMMLRVTPVCFSCHPKESKGQLEVHEFVRSLSADAVLSDRQLIAPQEVDVWVPSAHLAIEYNGLYWHSSSVLKDKDYHEKKRKCVAATGNKFFMIYEDEWRDKRAIIEGMLRHRLGRPLEVLDARKLHVEELDSTAAKVFFDSSHLEGHVRCSYALGLVDGRGRVVAAMSIRHPFHKSVAATSMEVGRSATLPGVSVRGWIGKLTSAAAKKSSSTGTMSLMSYVDARVGDGGSYVAAGWELAKFPGAARFWWTDFHNRYNRFKYKANKEAGLSQAAVAEAAGVVEIYGCGNYVMSRSLV